MVLTISRSTIFTSQRKALVGRLEIHHNAFHRKSIYSLMSYSISSNSSSVDVWVAVAVNVINLSFNVLKQNI